MVRTRLPAALAGITLVGVLLPVVGATAQDRGVAVDVTRIEVAEPLTPGSSYTLPPIGVRNPGEVSSDYRMTVQDVAGEASASPDVTWFTFAPETFSLEPDERRQVEIEMVVGQFADGDYRTLVSAQLHDGEPGARVGAAAATELSFTVVAGADGTLPLLTGWWWLIIASLITAALAVLRQLSRRYTFSVQRRS